MVGGQGHEPDGPVGQGVAQDDRVPAGGVGGVEAGVACGGGEETLDPGAAAELTGPQTRWRTRASGCCWRLKGMIGIAPSVKQMKRTRVRP